MNRSLPLQVHMLLMVVMLACQTRSSDPRPLDPPEAGVQAYDDKDWGTDDQGKLHLKFRSTIFGDLAKQLALLKLEGLGKQTGIICNSEACETTYMTLHEGSAAGFETDICRRLSDLLARKETFTIRASENKLFTKDTRCLKSAKGRWNNCVLSFSQDFASCNIGLSLP